MQGLESPTILEEFVLKVKSQTVQTAFSLAKWGVRVKGEDIPLKSEV